jgi:hypothetical protein
MTSTPIADIARDYEAYSQSLVGKDQCEKFRLADRFYPHFRARQREVARVFGELNGWTLAERSFTADAIGRAHTRWTGQFYSHGWMDHAIYFRARRPDWKTARCIAIVGQPYGDIDGHRRELLDACASKLGLRWHAPPNPRASIWYPPRTLFIVMTLADVVVRWLPEQEISDA